MQNTLCKRRFTSIAIFNIFLIFYALTGQGANSSINRYIFIVEKDEECIKSWKQAVVIDSINCCERVIVDSSFNRNRKDRSYFCENCTYHRVYSNNTYECTFSDMKKIVDCFIQTRNPLFSSKPPYTFVIVGTDKFFFEVADYLYLKCSTAKADRAFWNTYSSYCDGKIYDEDSITCEARYDIETEALESIEKVLRDQCVFTDNLTSIESDRVDCEVKDSEEHRILPYYLALLPFGKKSEVYNLLGSYLKLSDNFSWNDQAIKKALNVAIKGKPVFKDLEIIKPRSYAQSKLQIVSNKDDYITRGAGSLYFKIPKQSHYLIRAEYTTFYDQFSKWLVLHMKAGYDAVLKTFNSNSTRLKAFIYILLWKREAKSNNPDIPQNSIKSE